MANDLTSILPGSPTNEVSLHAMAFARKANWQERRQSALGYCRIEPAADLGESTVDRIPQGLHGSNRCKGNERKNQHILD